MREIDASIFYPHRDGDLQDRWGAGSAWWPSRVALAPRLYRPCSEASTGGRRGSEKANKEKHHHQINLSYRCASELRGGARAALRSGDGLPLVAATAQLHGRRLRGAVHGTHLGRRTRTLPLPARAVHLHMRRRHNHGGGGGGGRGGWSGDSRGGRSGGSSGRSSGRGGVEGRRGGERRGKGAGRRRQELVPVAALPHAGATRMQLHHPALPESTRNDGAKAPVRREARGGREGETHMSPPVSERTLLNW